MRSGSSQVFVGRDQELEQIHAAIEDAAGQEGRILLLTGEAGIGKTELAKRASNIAGQAGWQFGRGVSQELATVSPLWPWVRACSELGIETAFRQPRLASNGSESSRPDEISVQALATAIVDRSRKLELFERVAVALEDAAAQKPVLVWLEDLQWADESSIELTEYISRNGRMARTLLLITVRSGESGQQLPVTAEYLSRITRLPNAIRIDVSGLSDQSATELLNAVSGGIADETSLHSTLSITGGNPLYLTEIARARGRGASASGLPAELAFAIKQRLEQLSQKTRSVLTAASVLGQSFSFGQLQAISLNRDDEALLDAIDEALVHSYLQEVDPVYEHYEFSHPMIWRTLYESASASRRAQAHASAASSLEQLYGTDINEHAEEIFHHLSMAGRRVESTTLAKYAVLAGTRAMESLAWMEAISIFETVLGGEATELPGVTRAQILRELAMARMARFGGEDGANYQLFTDAFNLFLESGDTRAALEMACIPLTYPGGMREITEKSLQIVENGSREKCALLSRSGLLTDDYDTAEAYFREALEIANSLEDPWLEGWTLGRWMIVEHRDGNLETALDFAHEAVRLSEKTTDKNLKCHVYDHAARILNAHGQTDLALQYAQIGLQTAYEMDNDSRKDLCSYPVYYGTVMLGDFDAAREIVNAWFERSGTSEENPYPVYLTQAGVEYELGNDASGAVWLERSREVAAANTELFLNKYFDFQLRYETLNLRACPDQPYDEVQVSKLQAKLDLQDVPERFIGDFMLALGLCLLEVNDADSCGALAKRFGPPGNVGHGLVVGLEALSIGQMSEAIIGALHAAAGDLEEARRYFDFSVEWITRARRKPALANAYYEYARGLVRAVGEPGYSEAGEYLLQAQAICDEFGLAYLAGRCHEIETLISGAEESTAADRSGLTKRELEVLTLVATGRSNREIAEELFVSQNTVIRHVSNIYAKTGCSSRSEATLLAVRLGVIREP